MAAENLKKATIVVYGKDGVTKKTEIKVLFNPEQYSIEKSNQFASQPIAGQESPVVQYTRGDSSTLTVDLFFDTYTYHNGEDVRKYTDQIASLLKIDPELHAPPVCSFEWGKPIFVGVIERISKRFTMFKEDGTPVRATLNVAFRQIKDAGERFLSKESPDRTKIRVVKQGDSLWLFAAREYGDPSKWREIADANNIDNPLTLKPGTEIIIPPLK